MKNLLLNKNIQYYFSNIIEYIDKTVDLSGRNLLIQFLNDIKKASKSKVTEKAEFTSEIFDIILKETGGGINSLAAGLIFSFFSGDEINDLNIKGSYNKSISKIITGLMKVPDLKTEKIDKQSEKFIKFLLTITDDVRSVLILLVKQIYFIRHIELFSDDEQKIIVNQTLGLFIPLAHRIGLYNIKTELEERTMKFKEKDMYKDIAGKLKETKASRDVYIENFIKPLKKIIADSGYKAVVKGRPKSIHSIWNKMKEQAVPFEEVYDLFAIRVILKSDLKNEKAVCWNVYSIITDLYKPNPKRLRDWISSPKLSGYESLHTTVLGYENKWVEVQIRTERMDEIAEKGHAAHWRYKTGKESGSSDWLVKIREALENTGVDDSEINPNAKTELYSDEILVFTPEGDLKSLKRDYTVLDFAFSVHTKVGETCSGAVVNGKIQPLSYELKNGDTVKILTNKNKKPNPDWLEIAKGTRTKNKIKRALKSITYNRAASGKEIIKEKLERLKITFSERNIAVLADFFKFNTAVEFYHSVGEGTTDIAKIKQAFEKPEDTAVEQKVLSKSENFKKEEITSEDYLLIDENISNLDYTLSKCCNPLPGDSVFGFITVNKGTKIHKKTCPNAKDMIGRYPYRVVKAKWNIEDINTSFSANIYISGKDAPGITSEISDIITKEFNLKMQAISLKTLKNNLFEGLVVVKVNNKKQLIDLSNRIKMIKSIKSVYRK